MGTILYNSMESLRVVAVLISPFMPDTANRIRQQLGLDESFNDQGLDTVADWGGLPSELALGKPEPIFPRQDTKKSKQKSKEKPAEAEQSADDNLISFDQFQELDLRVAEVIAAEKVPRRRSPPEVTG